MIIERDVIIVGAGISGSIAAAYLAKAGADVLLLDKEVFPRDKACGDILTEEVVTHISRLDAFHELDRIGTCIRRAHLMGENGSECVIPFEGYVAPRFQLDSLLAKVAVKRGAEFRDGCRVRSLITEDTPKGLAVRGVNVRQYGVDYQVYGRLVMLADGADSILREDLELSLRIPERINSFTRNGEYVGERAYFAGVNLDPHLSRDRYNSYGAFGFHRKLANGYYWIVPSGEKGVAEGYCNVGIIRDPSVGSDVSASDIFSDLIESNPRVAALMLGAKQVTPWKKGVLRDVNSAKLRVGNGFIVLGDGASVMLPLLKNGIGAAADSGEAAAIAAKEAIRSNDFSAEFLSEEYVLRILPDEKRMKYENMTVESMYDVSVPMNMVARMTNNPAHVKRVMAEVFADK